MKRNFRECRPLTLLALLCAAPAAAEELSLPLPSDANATRTTAQYQCEDMGPLKIEYLTAGAISLALMKLDGQAQVFAQVLSGSGARYASGPYVWWIKGAEGALQDLRKGEGAKPVSCKATS